MKPILSLTVALLLATAGAASASGTYLPPNVRPPAKSSMDGAKYSLGQKTFEGKMMADGAASANSQMSALAALQARLPASKAKSTDLTKLAGKISSEQLAALEFYISKRFAN